ncbi:hypothetical protein A2567_00440 [Candidatus Azambacteria bacterium RIFOXYD1_FULL_42_11]|uniref:Uncharacterized protein n=4 Tax=Candidatus Azamiibacteriota TaxID=1752741 RepID=A0A0G1C915_9BACT|nr:MAG: hypothetical protein UV07_C0011G0008 [Candidatus Azambacteria bacterium GW2011_GWB1_42_17]KKS46098.1 MAG: hypothetical protein UV10_C0008G0008 [Candidatus Azambacteria bacterium GW2011_GWA1_42_19]KKS75334.1 MAG: hypothetical protein UV48_C0014G0017 [Candidatus Azambacteria bacterium GW2011_GWA2_42_9]KKS88277.1 MAG: hypothetical protein UV62_C0010G0006 [Parcubacteria group bacterium GW2011_GWC1_43_11]OGD41925.1 MAG: hypothetical protein A2567_00440 [Candidatus Azambacteria bacterium RIFO
MKRYTLDVNNETWKTLKQMQVETGVGSVTDVIQDSLRTYAYLIEEQKQGRLVIIKDPGTGLMKIIVPLVAQK